MPLYEYKCECGEHFEKIVKLKDEDKKQACPSCATEVERVQFSKGSFQLKGKWFKTNGEY